jgi:hypothetical protein
VNARLEARLLAHGIDAVTLSAGHRRKRRNHYYGPAMTIALLLVAFAALAFAR